MRSLVVVSVVLGMAMGQAFPRDTPEVEAARNAFIEEYNRLAKLAALAPDVHIYHRDPVLDPVTRMPRPINPPTFNAFSFSANLGSNQQFIPGPDIFTGASHMAGHMAGHQAPHRPAPHRPAPRRPTPTHQPVVPEVPRFRATAVPKVHATQVPLFRVTEREEPLSRWTGPFADEVPAGLSGHVQETPSVVAAKAAHFRAHADFWNQVTRTPAQR